MQSTASSYRSNNDAGVLVNSLLGQMLENNSLKLPSPAQLEGCNYNSFPYYFVGDEAFPLCEIMMHPYPGKLEEPEKIFNYRLSQARRVIEYAFCLLCTRWRIFSCPIKSSIKSTENFALAAIALHNYLQQTDNALYCPYSFIDSYDGNRNLKPGGEETRNARQWLSTKYK